MGKFDRCYLCDYTEDEGSLLCNVGSYENGSVRYNENLHEFICSVCEGTVIDNINLYEYELEEKECQDTTSPVPVDKVQTLIPNLITAEVIATPENAEVVTSPEKEM